MGEGNTDVVDGSGRNIRSRKQGIARGHKVQVQKGLWLPRKAGQGEPSDITARDQLADEKCAGGAKFFEGYEGI